MSNVPEHVQKALIEVNNTICKSKAELEQIEYQLDLADRGLKLRRLMIQEIKDSGSKEVFHGVGKSFEQVDPEVSIEKIQKEIGELNQEIKQLQGKKDSVTLTFNNCVKVLKETSKHKASN